MVGSARAIRAPLSPKQDTIILRTALPTLLRRSFELKIVVGCRQIVVLAGQRGSQLWGGVLKRRPMHLGAAANCGPRTAAPAGLHFLHHPVAMGLDRSLGPAYRAGDRLKQLRPATMDGQAATHCGG